MGSFIVVVCVIWLLYLGVKMLTRTLYKTEPINAKPERDVWGRREGEGPLYRRVNRATKDEDDEGLFQSVNRRQQARTEEKDVNASAAFYQSREWRALRYQALKKYGGACSACGRSAAKHGVVIHVDHIRPRSKYPHLALRLDNLQLLCHECNGVSSRSGCAFLSPGSESGLCESQEKYPKNARKASCLMQSSRHTGFCPAWRRLHM